MRALDIPFAEDLMPFDMAAGNPRFATFSTTNKVPVLRHGERTVWESLAIIEYLAETCSDKRLWPADAAARAPARLIACEMISGFAALRSECPMKTYAARRRRSTCPTKRRDVTRVLSIWCRSGPIVWKAMAARSCSAAFPQPMPCSLPWSIGWRSICCRSTMDRSPTCSG